MAWITNPRINQRVKAFHPRMMGVIKYGTVVMVRGERITIDFGPLNGGTFAVPKAHVFHELSTFNVREDDTSVQG